MSTFALLRELRNRDDLAHVEARPDRGMVRAWHSIDYWADLPDATGMVWRHRVTCEICGTITVTIPTCLAERALEWDACPECQEWAEDYEAVDALLGHVHTALCSTDRG